MKCLRRAMAMGVGILSLAVARWAPAGEPVTADGLLRQAYVAVVQAELAGQAGRRAEAIRAYRQALDLYGRLEAEYPGWQAEAIDYRMADCRNQIAGLEKATPDTAATAGIAGETNAESRLSRLLAELRAAGASLEPSKDASAADRERMRLQDERDEAVRTAQALQRRVQRLEEESRRAGRAPTNAVSTNLPLSAIPAVIKAESRRRLQAGEIEPALWLIREGERVVPDDLDLVVLHGLAACQGGRFAEAVEVLLPHDTRDLKQASVLVTLGSAYMGLGRIGDARVAMERALVLAPDSAEAHYNLAQILLVVKPPEAERAEAHYARAVQLGSRPDPALENSLRTAIIVARMKSRPRTKSESISRPVAPATLPTPAVKR